jgi:methylmalonyl-CoA mutase C-terminal domain/subunit
LSILSGAHLAISQKILELLKAQGAEGVPLLVGGIIPTQDVPELTRMGVAQVFLPGTTLADVISQVRKAGEARP